MERARASYISYIMKRVEHQAYVLIIHDYTYPILSPICECLLRYISIIVSIFKMLALLMIVNHVT